MGLSSGTVAWVEGLSMVEHGPVHGDAASGEGNESVDMLLSLAPFAIVEGFGDRVLGGDGAEGTLVEDALERLVAAIGSAKSSRRVLALPDWRRMGARPAAAAMASAGRKRVTSPAAAMNSAARTTPMLGGLRIRARSGWRATSASSSLSS